MGSNYTKEQEQKKLNEEDSEWFLERAQALIAELKVVKGERRTAFLRQMLRYAIEMQAKCETGASPAEADF
jgi:hypothetical protein